jgi:hypothetical protein
MKASQVKILLGWILALTILDLVVVVIVMINLGSVKMKVEHLNGGSSDSSQLSALQSSVSDLSSKVSAIPTSSSSSSPSPSSSELTCTGTLSQSLSGSASQVGSFTDYDLSGSSPIDLTCNPL